jgi:hypothetical protein
MKNFYSQFWNKQSLDLNEKNSSYKGQILEEALILAMKPKNTRLTFKLYNKSKSKKQTMKMRLVYNPDDY